MWDFEGMALANKVTFSIRENTTDEKK